MVIFLNEVIIFAFKIDFKKTKFILPIQSLDTQ